MRICITICTRERPVMLRACLDSVCVQAVPEGVEAWIAVVENNDRPAARAVADAVAKETGWRIDHVLEPELGIPFARTRCGRHALESGADWALYLDDDEQARPGWLAAFVAAAREHEAEVFYGRVIARYPTDTPAWMVEPEVNKRPSGALLKKAEGHNTLVTTRIFADPAQGGFGLAFDTTLRFTGGSDTEFFGRVHDHGGRIVWVPEAEVDEIVPASRMTVRWQLRRAFRVASSLAQVQARRRGPASASIKALARGIGRTCWALTVGPVRILANLPRREQRTREAFRAAKLLASAMGSLSYFAGVRPEPYRTVDGG